MNNLEKKIKANQALLAEKFVKINATTPENIATTKTGFTDGWDKGWGNHGGPPLASREFKSEN